MTKYMTNMFAAPVLRGTGLFFPKYFRVSISSFDFEFRFQVLISSFDF